MTSSNASKLLAMRLDAVSSDIVRICHSVESPYYKEKALLTEARSLLFASPKKSLRLMTKARKMMISESLAAQEYNRYRSLLPQLDSDKVAMLKSEYEKALMAGNYAKARKIALQIGRLEPVRKSGHSIIVTPGTITEDKVRIDVKNDSNGDIVIRSFNLESAGNRLDSDIGYPFVISKASVLNITLKRDGSYSNEGHLHLDYEENGIVKTIEKDIFLGASA